MKDGIVYSRDGTVRAFVGPDGVECFRAAVLASAIGLARVGIAPARGLTLAKLLRQAETLTGKKYKRSQAEQAQRDVASWCAEMRDALPHEVRP
jgi:hypothetical protein